MEDFSCAIILRSAALLIFLAEFRVVWEEVELFDVSSVFTILAQIFIILFCKNSAKSSHFDCEAGIMYIPSAVTDLKGERLLKIKT